MARGALPTHVLERCGSRPDNARSGRATSRGVRAWRSAARRRIAQAAGRDVVHDVATERGGTCVNIVVAVAVAFAVMVAFAVAVAVVIRRCVVICI